MQRTIVKSRRIEMCSLPASQSTLQHYIEEYTLCTAKLHCPVWPATKYPLYFRAIHPPTGIEWVQSTSSNHSPSSPAAQKWRHIKSVAGRKIIPANMFPPGTRTKVHKRVLPSPYSATHPHTRCINKLLQLIKCNISWWRRWQDPSVGSRWFQVPRLWCSRNSAVRQGRRKKKIYAHSYSASRITSTWWVLLSSVGS